MHKKSVGSTNGVASICSTRGTSYGAFLWRSGRGGYGRGEGGGCPRRHFFWRGGTFSWSGTFGFKYLMYYSNTDLDPQSAFTSYQKCSKVLSECGKCHFRDTNFNKFQGGMAPDPPRLTHLTAGTYIVYPPPPGGGRHFKNSPPVELLLATFAFCAINIMKCTHDPTIHTCISTQLIVYFLLYSL